MAPGTSAVIGPENASLVGCQIGSAGLGCTDRQAGGGVGQLGNPALLPTLSAVGTADGANTIKGPHVQLSVGVIPLCHVGLLMRYCNSKHLRCKASGSYS